MSQLDPNDFIITRKRKKYRFALFHNSPLCFELEEWDADWQPDILEVGAGDGLFAVSLAETSPDKKFIAVDVKADRLQKGARLAEEKGLGNIRFVRVRADQLADIVTSASLTSIWLTFSDPFPKKRSGGRRLTHPTYLKLYESLLKTDGSLYVKHDDLEFFSWSLEQLVGHKWHIDELSFDLHESNLSDQYKIMTTYEIRWMTEGKRTQFVKASRNANLES